MEFRLHDRSRLVFLALPALRAAAVEGGHLQQRRRLHVSETSGGMVRIDAEFDPEGGRIVLTALRALTDSHQLDSDDKWTVGDGAGGFISSVSRRHRRRSIIRR